MADDLSKKGPSDHIIFDRMGLVPIRYPQPFRFADLMENSGYKYPLRCKETHPLRWV